MNDQNDEAGHIRALEVGKNHTDRAIDQLEAFVRDEQTNKIAQAALAELRASRQKLDAILQEMLL